jgi:hypothetical protein
MWDGARCAHGSHVAHALRRRAQRMKRRDSAPGTPMRGGSDEAPRRARRPIGVNQISNGGSPQRARPLWVRRRHGAAG